MTLVRREIQNVRLVFRSIRRSKLFRIFVTTSVAVLAFVACITDISRLDPPFGGGGSAVAVAV